MRCARWPSSGGRELLLFDAGPSDTIGALPLLDRGPLIARFAARLRGTAVAVVPRDVVEECLAADRAFAAAFHRVCAARSRAFAERLIARIDGTTTARIACAIASYAEGADGPVPPSSSLRTLRRRDLAVAAGTVVDVAARELARLEAAGAIARRGGHIVRIDRALLVRFAGALGGGAREPRSRQPRIGRRSSPRS